VIPPSHVGIVGCSPPGAALCFEIISSRAGMSRRPFEVSMHSHAFSNYMNSIGAQDWDGVAQLMLSSARKLERVGAEFLIAPCNTIHQAFDRVAGESPLPWLHIADEVALEAQRIGYKRVALLGTKFMMEGPVYPSYFSRCGIELPPANSLPAQRPPAAPPPPSRT
jgi:aspartate/glutamate racemase